MDARSLFNEIQAFCRENANEENIRKSQRYFKEEFDGYGLTTVQIQQKVKELLRRKEFSLPLVLETIPLLMDTGKHEMASLGLLLMNGLPREYTSETFTTIESWFSIGIRDWAHADITGSYILSKFIDQNVVSIYDFEKWLYSPYKFQRRCVPVAFIKPMKKNRKVASFISFVEPLMNDQEREVHQGVGWFLREAWKIQKDETEAFLLKWKETAPRLIIQYACEKMTADEKVRFKRSK
jgi:3-methyladenine DNA glycosylase AlkD